MSEAYPSTPYDYSTPLYVPALLNEADKELSA